MNPEHISASDLTGDSQLKRTGELEIQESTVRAQSSEIAWLRAQAAQFFLAWTTVSSQVQTIIDNRHRV